MKEEVKNKTHVKITYNTYKKIVKTFPIKIFKRFTISSIIWLLISLVAMIPDETDPDPCSWGDLIITDVIIILSILVIVCVIDCIFKRVYYKNFVKENKNSIEYDIQFYKDNFKIKNENMFQKINYSDVRRYKERDFMLYLLIGKYNIIPVSELELDSDLVNYIKYSIDNKEKNITTPEVKKEINKNDKKRKGIETILLLLFIFSFFTPWIGLFGWGMLTIHNGATDLSAFNYTYGALIGLVIPLLSLILGIIYNQKGINCVKNIVIGIIMCGLILIMSSFSLLSKTFETDYSKISVYKDIINIELPKNAKYTNIKWDESYLKNNISSSVKFEDKNESDIFYDKVKNNDNWILYKNVSTILNNFIPSSLVCHSDDRCYYSIYIDELNKYNTIPPETGDYHIKTLMYDPDISTLKIEDFEYTYKK